MRADAATSGFHPEQFPPLPVPLRHLVIVLGDQLDRDSSALQGFDPARDAVWMAEVDEESEHVWSHPARIALFLSAMRHFALDQARLGRAVRYHALGTHAHRTLGQALATDLAELRPQRLIAVRAGDWRVWTMLQGVAASSGIALAERPDSHFLLTPDEFAVWAKGRRELRLEHFYRWMRRRENVLMREGKPMGGRWNYDSSNRDAFDVRGPGLVPAPRRFAPDAITRAVLEQVRTRFASHPGGTTEFDWPVTPAQARDALDDFLRQRIAGFGRWQDAMWPGEPWLYHSRLSAAMNLKLIAPRVVIEAACTALHSGAAPIEAVEGFVRQILGWREFVRGVYWLHMPGYLEHNALGASAPLPDFYWSGDTDMACLRDALGQTLRLGYAHHIQRLMVTGLFALLLGVEPRQVHRWYLAVYVDAVEWVEVPNTLGMSQYADGGIVASKPYCASGRYIQRMSGHCSGCRFDPGQALGERACPFTTLYWDFLDRHRARFDSHPRAALQWRSLERIAPERLAQIRSAAAALRVRFGVHAS